LIIEKGQSSVKNAEINWNLNAHLAVILMKQTVSFAMSVAIKYPSPKKPLTSTIPSHNPIPPNSWLIRFSPHEAQLKVSESW
jgi:hypothetical protein